MARAIRMSCSAPNALSCNVTSSPIQQQQYYARPLAVAAVGLAGSLCVSTRCGAMRTPSCSFLPAPFIDPQQRMCNLRGATQAAIVNA